MLIFRNQYPKIILGCNLYGFVLNGQIVFLTF